MLLALLFLLLALLILLPALFVLLPPLIILATLLLLLLTLLFLLLTLLIHLAALLIVLNTARVHASVIRTLRPLFIALRVHHGLAHGRVILPHQTHDFIGQQTPQVQLLGRL